MLLRGAVAVAAVVAAVVAASVAACPRWWRVEHFSGPLLPVEGISWHGVFTQNTLIGGPAGARRRWFEVCKSPTEVPPGRRLPVAPPLGPRTVRCVENLEQK